MFAEVLKGLLENESEDQAQDGECFGQGQAEECYRLQDALGFRLARNAVDVGSEHETHTDTTADSREAIADEVEGAVDGAFHFFSFQDATLCGRLFGLLHPRKGKTVVCGRSVLPRQRA